MDLSTYKELLAFGVFIIWPLLIFLFFAGIAGLWIFLIHA